MSHITFNANRITFEQVANGQAFRVPQTMVWFVKRDGYGINDGETYQFDPWDHVVVRGND